MKIVIDIPEKYHKKAKEWIDADTELGTAFTAIANGIPLPKGKWIKRYQNVNGTDFEVQNKACSECNKPVKYKYPFCPWCGADMRGDE